MIFGTKFLNIKLKLFQVSKKKEKEAIYKTSRFSIAFTFFPSK